MSKKMVELPCDNCIHIKVCSRKGAYSKDGVCEYFTVEPDDSGYTQGMVDEYHHIMDILRRSNVTVCLEDKRLLTICEYVEMKERGEL